METALWVFVFILFLYLWNRRRYDYGTVVLAPGEGTFRINTLFHPKKVKLHFCGCSHVPGCSQLEDTAEVESIDCDGFTVRYKVQSGTRSLRWRAYA